MHPILRFANSSVGKKILMSLTGLFLSIFLVEHLIGNLLLLKGDGGEAYNAYAKFMGGNPLVRTMEVGLIGLLLLHIVNGIRVWWNNRAAREKSYGAYKLHENTTLQARFMKVSAAFVLFFLLVHLRTFWVRARFGGEHDVAGLVAMEFQSGIFVLFYLASLGILSYHLRHGFQSAFQTLGWRTNKYIGLIEFIAVLFWLVIPIGFAIIPVYLYFVGGSAVASVH